MNQDEIIEIARQAGIDYIEHISKDSMKKVKAFVKLVAAKEREACARIVESNADACSCLLYTSDAADE